MGKEHEPLRKKVKAKTVGVAAAAIFRGVASFIACPGDDIALMASSFAIGADQTHHAEQSAILPDKPTLLYAGKKEKKPQL